MIEGHDYTIYSGGPGGRSRMYALLAIITAFLTPLAQHGFLIVLRKYFGDDWDIAETALFFGGFTALILYGILINLFDGWLWRTWAGGILFRVAGLPAPPDLVGEYAGTITVVSGTGGEPWQTACRMRIAQTWEQIAILIERAHTDGSQVRSHSDMASLQIGMVSGTITLRDTYTFEECLSRRHGTGLMTRQFSGAAVLEFRLLDGVWTVHGHFFDDDGRSGQIELRRTREPVTQPTAASAPSP